MSIDLQHNPTFEFQVGEGATSPGIGVGGDDQFFEVVLLFVDSFDHAGQIFIDHNDPRRACDVGRICVYRA